MNTVKVKERYFLALSTLFRCLPEIELANTDHDEDSESDFAGCGIDHDIAQASLQHIEYTSLSLKVSSSILLASY